MGEHNFLVGMLIGSVMSIPFGPIGAVCINRILQRGALAGMASGFGVALGDCFFAALAVLGISQVSEFLLHYQLQLELFAGLLIMAGGIRSYFTEPAAEETAYKGLHAIKDATGMFFITLANPQTILGLSLALAGTVRFYQITHTADAFVLLAGIFSGSILWWILFTLALEVIRRHIRVSLAHRLHRISAALLAVIGLLLIGHAIVSGMLPGEESLL